MGFCCKQSIFLIVVRKCIHIRMYIPKYLRDRYLHFHRRFNHVLLSSAQRDNSNSLLRYSRPAPHAPLSDWKNKSTRGFHRASTLRRLRTIYLIQSNALGFSHCACGRRGGGGGGAEYLRYIFPPIRSKKPPHNCNEIALQSVNLLTIQKRAQ